MQSLYGKYLAEKTDDLIVETEQGFATYRFLNKDQVYIIDIYVLPEFRKQGFGTILTDKVCKHAEEQGCKELLGTVLPASKNSTLSIKALLAYGLKLHSISNDAIILKKDL